MSRKQIWTGRTLSSVAVAFLLWDSTIKLLLLTPVVESLERLGFPAGVARPLGAIELTCVLLAVMPRTAVLGALLLTGFLGGAVAAHTRMGDPLGTHVLFPVYVALLVWGGLLLREPRLRPLVGVGTAP
jgi:hypothetical protein